MSKKQAFIPAYRRHRARNLAVVTLNGVDHYLGKWNSPESKVEYDRLICGTDRSRPSSSRPGEAVGRDARQGVEHRLEAGQILLGHAKADVTQIYAERDLAKAVEIARRIGGFPFTECCPWP